MKELRQLIREATEEDVLRGLAGFDSQAASITPGGKLVFHDEGFDAEVQKMAGWSRTKPFTVAINGEIKTSKPSMADAIQTARSYYEKHLRRILKVRKAPVERAPEVELSSEERAERLRDKQAEEDYKELKRREKLQKLYDKMR